MWFKKNRGDIRDAIVVGAQPRDKLETEEVKITRCLPLYGRNTKKKEDRKTEKGRRIATIEEKKIERWAVDGKKD